MHCKDCRFLNNVGNTEETGIAMCTYPSMWFPTGLDDECHYLPEAKELTCGDCANLGEDFACSGYSADDSAYDGDRLCSGFSDKRIEDLWSMMVFWKQHGIYDRDKVIEALDKYEAAYDELVIALKEGF